MQLMKYLYNVVLTSSRKEFSLTGIKNLEPLCSRKYFEGYPKKICMEQCNVGKYGNMQCQKQCKNKMQNAIMLL